MAILGSSLKGKTEFNLTFIRLWIDGGIRDQSRRGKPIGGYETLISPKEAVGRSRAQYAAGWTHDGSSTAIIRLV